MVELLRPTQKYGVRSPYTTSWSQFRSSGASSHHVLRVTIYLTRSHRYVRHLRYRPARIFEIIK